MRETARNGWGFRLTPTRLVMMGIAAVTIFIICYRLVMGLGAVTNLNDQWPWGFWISFDVLLGVALAGGGYGMALIVYILRIDRYHAIARSAKLTSMLGYIIVVLGLLIEVGQWFNGWRPFVSWGYHSVLFEVFWCVSVYTLIQIIAFGEIATERIFKRFNPLFRKIMPILLVVGVTLPTLHQSSLGELFALMPGKVDGLWETPIIFLLFLLSSFFVGPAMIAVESRLSGRALKHKADMSVLRGLIRVSGTVMLIYLAVKIGDLVSRDQLGHLFDGSFASNMFLLELGAGVVIPIFLAFSKAARTNAGQLWFGWLAIGGVVLNRFNMTTTAMQDYLGASGGTYWPAVSEIIVSLGLVCIACLAYLFIAENFTIVEEHDDHEEVASVPVKGPVDAKRSALL